jgi:hypothetical protein
MEEDHGKRQARAQVDSIAQMVKRLEHSQECRGDEDCPLTLDELREGLDIWQGEAEKHTIEQLRESYHDQDAALEAISEDPLDLTRKGDSYEILLCTGGPAARIVGNLMSGVAISAKMQYQDWYTPWTDFWVTAEEDKALEAYARCFYFGEVR